MTIYVDGLFALNACLNALLLLGSARLAGAPVRRWRLAAAAALGGLYAVACVVPGLAFLGRLPGKLLAMAAMVSSAFGLRRGSGKLALLFAALSAALAGVITAMVQVFGTGLMVIGGAAYYPVSGRTLLLTAAVLYVLSRTVLARLARHTGGELVPVELQSGGRTVKLTALRDTGNTLQDPATGRGVLVAEWPAVRALLPPEAAAALGARPPDDAAALLPALARAVPAGKWRLIPYRAVGTAGGLLLAMACDCIRVDGRPDPGGIVAFSPTPLSDGGGYTALIGGSV